MDESDTAELEEQITSIIELRRERLQFFGQTLFSDIAWDILLQLFLAKLKSQSLSLSELVSSAAESTIARWAAVLEEQGLVQCSLDTLAPGRMRLELSNSGEAKMYGLFRNHRHLRLLAEASQC